MIKLINNLVDRTPERNKAFMIYRLREMNRQMKHIGMDEEERKRRLIRYWNENNDKEFVCV